MTKKSSERGLGRGLSALMSDVSVAAAPKETPKSKNKPKKKPVKKPVKKTAKAKPETAPANQRGVTYVAIDQLERNPDQPRKYFDKEKLSELTQSIKDKGVLQPIWCVHCPLKKPIRRHIIKLWRVSGAGKPP